jgi:hypothetical protein
MSNIIPTNNSDEAAVTTELAGLFNKLVLQADLSKLSETELVQYYHAVCKRAGLDPMTKPFEVLVLNGRKTLYATKTAAAQLTAIHSVSVTIVDKGRLGEDTYFAQARVTKRDGTTVEDIGVVSIANVRGEGLSNAIMKAVTKAKRRAILSAFGIGLNDESEMEDVPNANLLKNSINPAIAAELTQEQADEVDSLTDMLIHAEDAADLTAYIHLIRDLDEVVRLKLKPVVLQTQERLNVVWLNGKYTPKIIPNKEDE